MFVFVLDKNKKPLNSTHPARARRLLRTVKVTKPLFIKATGYGHRRMSNINRFGFPQVNKKGELAVRSRVKVVSGFQTGDMVKAVVPKGKNAGTHVGRVTVRATGQFDISTLTRKLQIINWKYCKPIHRQDGYSYAEFSTFVQ